MEKISNNRIPFGLKNDRMVDVSAVESGLACGCICPSCKRDLQANKGKVVSHYFSHDPSAETRVCESAFETSIHLMAKQILSEESYSMLPGLTISLSKPDLTGKSHKEKIVVEAAAEKVFEGVELEKRLEGIRPDIISYTGGKPLLIEVAVTSFADSKKKQIIRSLGLPAIEIDLSSVGYATTKEELRKLVVSSAKNKHWLSNPKAVDAKKELNVRLDEKIRLINEGNKGRGSTPRKQVNHTFGQVPEIPRSEPREKDGIMQYNPRWFVCEACSHLFNVPLRDAPYSIETIPCPECDYAVSAKPPSPKQTLDA